MHLSKASVRDLEVVRAFAEHTFRFAFQSSNDPERFEAYCARAFSEEQFSAELEHPSSSFWLAWEDHKLVAYLKLNFDQHPEVLGGKNTVQVERLYVEPSMQGRKIGEKILEFAYDQARALGAKWIWLSVWQDNPPALRFYERCGYEIFGTKTFWLGDEAQTDWLVRKSVAP